jgi:uncharacterized protein
MNPLLPVVPDNTPAEIEAFETTCNRLAGFDDRLDPESIDGYLTALAAGPRAVDIDEWLPRLCGDTFLRTFADPADEAGARAALQRRAAVLQRQLDPEALLDRPDFLRLAPWMAQWTDEDRQRLVEVGQADAAEVQTLQTGAAWAAGFVQALNDFADDWQPATADDEAVAGLDEMVSHVAVLALPPDSEEFRSFVAEAYGADLPDRDALIDGACFAVQDLRVWWLDHGPRPATRRVEKAPGRNEPCPCGSGRKFKHCHGKGA